MKTIRVKTLLRAYPVLVGNNLTRALAGLLGRRAGAGRVFVCCDANVYPLHARAVIGAVEKKAEVIELVIPAGEKSKSASVLEGVYDFFLSELITRDDFILAIGGGSTSDLTGFAAATTMRGIAWGVVPTTLVGMVDAAIGGKTGINHSRGKNLIGAFWQPSLVVCDTAYLGTLPRRELVSGLGEVVKTVGLAGVKELSALARYLQREEFYDPAALAGLVAMSIAYKARVVAKDEHDRGARMVLNFGHTFAHGIEKALGYGRLLHGEAVIIGVEAALALGEKRGFVSSRLVRYRELVAVLMSRLPRRRIDPDKVFEAMALDKKRSARGLRYVLLADVGKPIVTDRVASAEAREALNAALAKYRHTGGSNA